MFCYALIHVRSSAGESVKSQRNAKESSKSADAIRPRGVSSSRSENVASGGFSQRGESVPTIYEIGPFRFDPQAGVLTRVGIVEPLGARAAAVLSVLVRNGDKAVTKNAI